MADFAYFSKEADDHITTKFTKTCRENLRELFKSPGTSLEITVDNEMPPNCDEELKFWSTVVRYSKRTNLLFIRVLLKNEQLSIKALSGFIKKMHRDNILDKIYFLLEEVGPRKLNEDLFPRFREVYLLNISVNCRLVPWFTTILPVLKKNQVRLLELRQARFEQVTYPLHNRSQFHSLRAILIESIKNKKYVMEGINRAKRENKSVTLVTLEEQNSKKYDCFLSHNWGFRASNHKKIRELELELKENGISCWLDEIEMKDNLNQMRIGIDQSKIFFAFITNDYIRKAFIPDTNIRKEYCYALNAPKPFVIIQIEPIEKDHQKYLDQFNDEVRDRVFDHVHLTDSCFTEEKVKEILYIVDRLP